ncbi:MAG: hypothetical protein JSS07_06725 [Proteobacteria bacterium]|nr:hypothetical protein [Pseudomonadota bacterium]
MIGILNKLAETLKNIQINNNVNSLRQLDSAFCVARTDVHKIVWEKRYPVDFRTHPANENLKLIALKLNEVLALNTSKKCPHLVFEVIQAISLLKIPMDFPLTMNDKTIQLDSILSEICKKAAITIINDPKAVDPSTYVAILLALEHVNIDSSAALRENAQKLIFSCLKNASDSIIAQNQDNPKYNAERCIVLLRSNAVLSIQNDGTYHSALKYEQLDHLLYFIDKEVTAGKLVLTLSLVTQLYQTYAADYYNKRDSFPPTLLKKMKTFLPEFKNTTKSSGFEMDVEKLDFKSWNGIFPAFQKYNYISWQENLNFSNQIIDEIGFETDILFTHPQTKTKIAIQVDGEEYHNFNVHDKANETLNKQTQFRDYCFHNAGYETVRITKRGIEHNIPKLIDKIVFPVHSALQRNKLDSLKEQKAELEKRNNMLFQNINEQKRQLLNSSSINYDDLLKELSALKPTLTELDENLEYLEQKINNNRHANYQQLYEQKKTLNISLRKAQENKEVKLEELAKANLNNAKIDKMIKVFDKAIKEILKTLSVIASKNIYNLNSDDIREINLVLKDPTLTEMIKKGLSRAQIKNAIGHLEKVLNASPNPLEEMIALKKHEMACFESSKASLDSLQYDLDIATANYDAVNLEFHSIHDKMTNIEKYLEQKFPYKKELEKFEDKKQKVLQVLEALENKLKTFQDSKNTKSTASCFSYSQKLVFKKNDKENFIIEHKQLLQARVQALTAKAHPGYVQFLIEEVLTKLRELNEQNITEIEGKISTIEGYVGNKTKISLANQIKAVENLEKCTPLIFQMKALSLNDAKEEKLSYRAAMLGGMNKSLKKQ